MFDASVNESHVYYDKRPIYGSGQVVEKTKPEKRKKMYSPSFSELACISVRRFSWAMGTNMVKAVDVMVKSLPAIIKPEIVCSACKDNSKCMVCIFKVGEVQQPKILDLLM
ncbi:MAG: hypothetical protein FWG29_06775 [Treponema sp.]|jgi:hypothetical protein|nr:hypothetical protein [Treponema sp.]